MPLQAGTARPQPERCNQCQTGKIIALFVVPLGTRGPGVSPGTTPDTIRIHPEKRGWGTAPSDPSRNTARRRLRVTAPTYGELVFLPMRIGNHNGAPLTINLCALTVGQYHSVRAARTEVMASALPAREIIGENHKLVALVTVGEDAGCFYGELDGLHLVMFAKVVKGGLQSLLAQPGYFGDENRSRQDLVGRDSISVLH